MSNKKKISKKPVILKRKGGRPEKKHIKEKIKYIMRTLKMADVNLVKKAYIQKTGQNANYHTIKKYMEELVSDGILTRSVVSDNIKNVKEGQSKQRRKIDVYRTIG